MVKRSSVRSRTLNSWIQSCHNDGRAQWNVHQCDYHERAVRDLVINVGCHRELHGNHYEGNTHYVLVALADPQALLVDTNYQC